MSGSGISRAMCKPAPRSRQITMPAPHHSACPLSPNKPKFAPRNAVKNSYIYTVLLFSCFYHTKRFAFPFNSALAAVQISKYKSGAESMHDHTIKHAKKPWRLNVALNRLALSHHGICCQAIMCINAVLFTFLSLLYISDGTYAMTEKLSLVHCRCYTCQLQLCKHILSWTVFMAERFSFVGYCACVSHVAWWR